jgi:hypothetical protein
VLLAVLTLTGLPLLGVDVVAWLRSMLDASRADELRAATTAR